VTILRHPPRLHAIAIPSSSFAIWSYTISHVVSTHVHARLYAVMGKPETADNCCL
jgi:hypothetical protein